MKILIDFMLVTFIILFANFVLITIMYEQRIVGPPEFRKSGTRVWKNIAELCLFYENYYFMFFCKIYFFISKCTIMKHIY